jgi:stress-induced morphogen
MNVCIGGCGSFYAIQIEHSSFKGLNTIKQHRLVNELLKDEIKGMHGLQVESPTLSLV